MLDDRMFISPYGSTWAADKSRERSALTWKHILDKPTDIVIQRDDVFLASQKVRIEGYLQVRNPGQMQFTNMETYTRIMTIFGIRDHPTIPDTDIQVGDRFGVNGEIFNVIEVTPHAGEYQIQAERYQP
jgi:hypothetical protein